MSENSLYARFIWREPGTGRPYDIERIENLAFIPRVGEEVEIRAHSNYLHSFEFDECFIVEQVTYRLMSSPHSSPDPGEDGAVLADEQVVRIYVQPQDKHGWATVQRIKKEFGAPIVRKRKEV